MAARKLQQEIDKCFKKVAEGVQAFEGIYDKLQQCTNASQKEKLEEALKKEIKKLQRNRDQIKAWAAMNDIKDKKPLLEQRKLIETQMEKFKAVEKEMKTKAYSKEGLMASSKLDPKEKEKLEMSDFLSTMVDELERQIESIEAEVENLAATVKKGKKDKTNAERVADLEHRVERHKWHVGKLELLMRALENGSLEAEQVKDLEEGIKYYVESNSDVDFAEDEELYEDLNLQNDEELYGMANDMDRVSSQDTQSIQDEAPELDKTTSGKGKAAAVEPAATTRRPSTQLKSPLPSLAQLHQPLPNATNGAIANNMKPAPLPTGATLKYASAAAAAAASDKNGVGIAPLPPPPGATPAVATPGLAPLPAAAPAKQSPSTAPSQPISPAPSHASATVPSAGGSMPPTPAMDKVESAQSLQKNALVSEDETEGETKKTEPERSPEADAQPPTPSLTNGETGDAQSEAEEESIYHLPASLQDLVDSLEATKSSAMKEIDQRLLAASYQTAPESIDAERPRHYRPEHPNPYTPAHYPQEPLPIFDDPRLYSQVDPDTLFYAFYYRQGTYQQYLAAKALKSQSWRFHKQYQTWFQRHEEPKQITDDYEQGTYRFFDYESTWMNRRKADFKFHYKFLEDDIL
ncbi:CCR4-NOT transcription complex [Rhizodiscina lignyota]|uniref:General negative regulator of transcription subunit n=1 Tax=Rhizodiscina lignyota TaxID=1504668 RepID=A0A9P4M5D4_9PEZI|nr:CCR4-NOT transcription complex [Rhizodiscina lignyota]